MGLSPLWRYTDQARLSQTLHSSAISGTSWKQLPLSIRNWSLPETWMYISRILRILPQPSFDSCWILSGWYSMWTKRHIHTEASWTWPSQGQTAWSIVSRSIHRQYPTTDRCPASCYSLCLDPQFSSPGSFVAEENLIAISSEQLVRQARSARTTCSTMAWTPHHSSSCMRIHFATNSTCSCPVTVSDHDLTLPLPGSMRHVAPWSVCPSSGASLPSVKGGGWQTCLGHCHTGETLFLQDEGEPVLGTHDHWTEVRLEETLAHCVDRSW